MIDVLVTGVTSGLLYGLLGFSVVVLFRMTGVPNFAQGSFAALGAVVAYKLAVGHNVNLAVAGVIAVLVMATGGLCVYLLVMRPRDDAGPLNLTVRTLGLYLLLFAVTDKVLGQGQPFAFPHIFPTGRLSIPGGHVPETSLGILAVAIVLTAAFVVLFKSTRLGLLLRGLAADKQTARLLGANVRLLDAVAWIAASALAAVVGVLTAPSSLVSADMMDNSLLFVFAGVVIGGLTSLAGAFVGGIAVGVVQGIASYYGNADLALLAVFGLFLLTLLVRPDGLFGERVAERL